MKTAAEDVPPTYLSGSDWVFVKGSIVTRYKLRDANPHALSMRLTHSVTISCSHTYSCKSHAFAEPIKWIIYSMNNVLTGRGRMVLSMRRNTSTWCKLSVSPSHYMASTSSDAESQSVTEGKSPSLPKRRKTAASTSTGKKWSGAAVYKSKFQSTWQQTWPFIAPVKSNPHSFEQLMPLGSISHSFSCNLTHFHSTSHSFTIKVVGISVS